MAGEFHVQPGIHTPLHRANLHRYTSLARQSRPKIDDIFLLTEVNGKFKIKLVLSFGFEVIMRGSLELLRPPGPPPPAVGSWKGACVPPNECGGYSSYRTFSGGVLLPVPAPKTSPPAAAEVRLMAAVASCAAAPGERVTRLGQITFGCEDILIHGN